MSQPSFSTSTKERVGLKRPTLCALIAGRGVDIFCRGGRIRTPGSVSRSSVFKTDLVNHLSTPLFARTPIINLALCVCNVPKLYSATRWVFVVRTGFEPVSLKGPLKESGGQLGMGTYTHLVYSNPLEVLLLYY